MFADNVARFASNTRSVLRTAEPAFYGTLALLLSSQILFVTGHISWPEVLMAYSGVILGNMAVCGAAPVTGWLTSVATRLVPQPQPQPQSARSEATAGAALRTRFVRVARIIDRRHGSSDRNNDNTGPSRQVA